MTALALDGRVDLASAADRLRWAEQRRYSYGSVYEVDGRKIYLFRFGAVVFDEIREIDGAVLSVIQHAVGQQFLIETRETYFVTEDPSHSGSVRVGWDQVVVPERSSELMSAVALLLGQSAALERYEKAAQTLLDEALGLSKRLAETGTVPRADATQVKRIGRLTELRLQLASWFFLLDRPEETWEYASVEQLYEKLFSNLELGERHRAMLDKFEVAENVTDIVVNTRQSIVSNRLEWTIVILIVVEIVLALFHKV